VRPLSTLTLTLTLTALAGSGATAAADFGNRVTMSQKSAATFYVTGEITGAGPVEFLVDTGSGYVTINQRTLDPLASTGEAHYVKQLRGVLADGSAREVPVYALAHIRIGDCWLSDVEAAVLPGDSRQILGLSALRKAAPFIFSIDPPALSLSGCETAALSAAIASAPAAVPN
jgi:clan AA aspartic protease (TIGR02281 family)